MNAADPERIRHGGRNDSEGREEQYGNIREELSHYKHI